MSDTELRIVRHNDTGEHPRMGDPQARLGDIELEAQLGRICHDPIGALYERADTVGFSGQSRQLVLLTIAGVSAGAGTPVNVLCVSEPGGGKSIVIKAVVEIVGPDFIATAGTVQSMTSAAFSRMAEGITHHTLVFDERTRGNEEFGSMVRMAASGQTATRVITVKGEPVELRVLPPVAFIDPSLPDRPMSLQDRSRCLRIAMGTDAVTRDTITSSSLARYTLNGRRQQDSLREFARAFQLFLSGLQRDLTVVVPFAPLVRIPKHSPLRDRLLNNVLNAVCTVAWLRQSVRDRRTDDGVGEYIEAAIDDYRVVYDIVVSIGEDGSDGELPDNALLLLRLWRHWIGENGNAGLPREQFGAVTDSALSPWQTYRALKELDKAGYAMGPSGRGRTGRWTLTDLGLRADHPNLFQLLPAPDELAEQAQNCKPGP